MGGALGGFGGGAFPTGAAGLGGGHHLPHPQGGHMPNVGGAAGGGFPGSGGFIPGNHAIPNHLPGGFPGNAGGNQPLHPLMHHPGGGGAAPFLGHPAANGGIAGAGIHQHPQAHNHSSYSLAAAGQPVLLPAPQHTGFLGAHPAALSGQGMAGSHAAAPHHGPGSSPLSPQRSNAAGPTPPPSQVTAPPANRAAILIAGAPRTGKTAVAERLAADLKMTAVVYNVQSTVGDNLDKLREKVRSLPPACTPTSQEPLGAHGLILDSFGCESPADIFYLWHALADLQVAVVHVIYFSVEVASLKAAANAASRPGHVVPSLSSAEMHRHAVAYETCSLHFSSEDASPASTKFSIIACTGDARNPLRSPEDIVSELSQWLAKKFATPTARGAPPRAQRLLPLPLKPFALATESGNSDLVQSYSEFVQLLHDLGEALETDLEQCFPPRNARNNFDYGKFARVYSRLSKYKMSCVTDSPRVVLFQHRDSLYYLPESGQHIMKFCPGSVAVRNNQKTIVPEDRKGALDRGASGSRAIVFAAEADVHVDELSEDGGPSRKTELLVVRDYLCYGDKRCGSFSREQRLKLLNPQAASDPQETVQGGKDAFLIARSFECHEVDAMLRFGVKLGGSTPILGYRLDHEGPYVMGLDDPAAFTWYERAPPIVVRLWDSREVTEGWVFSMYWMHDACGAVATTSSGTASPVTSPERASRTGSSSAFGGFGEEAIPGCALQVTFDMAEKLQLNDGQLVEVEYDSSKSSTATSGAAASAAPPRGGGKSAPSAANHGSHGGITGVFSLRRRRMDLYWPMYRSQVMDRLKWNKWEQCRKLLSSLKEPRDDDGVM